MCSDNMEVGVGMQFISVSLVAVVRETTLFVFTISEAG